MVIQLVRAEPHQVSELGRICFEAFKDVEERHHLISGFPTIAEARNVIDILVQREDWYSVAALIDGKLVGSNFLSLTNSVAGVGPLSVDLSFQGQGIGRALMADVMEYARRNNIERIRLQQEACDTRSLSLYASLGFEVKAPVALMQATPAVKVDSSVRPVTPADLSAIEELSIRIYKTNRRNEVATATRFGLSPLLREHQGRITGYVMLGLTGHGVAETQTDALTLIGEAARRLLPDAAFFLCPLSEASLYRKALKAGHRAIKVHNLMTLGPYEPPDEVWLPSIQY